MGKERHKKANRKSIALQIAMGFEELDNPYVANDAPWDQLDVMDNAPPPALFAFALTPQPDAAQQPLPAHDNPSPNPSNTTATTFGRAKL